MRTRSTSGTRRHSKSNAIKLLVAALAIAALIKELRLPKDQRTWHGTIAWFVPYDFRMPTIEKIKQTFWNPDGPIFVARAFGVGWTINFGAVVTRARTLAGTG